MHEYNPYRSFDIASFLINEFRSIRAGWAETRAKVYSALSDKSHGPTERFWRSKSVDCYTIAAEITKKRAGNFDEEEAEILMGRARRLEAEASFSAEAF